MTELNLIEYLSTGGDAATVGLIYLVYRQSTIMQEMREKIIKLETEIEAYIKR
ncbi:hypothetical protein [Hydrogenovibrio sp. SC-1]|uniref:hypothetical protein n=1 Tax=Hydrogenovibrio sp. SC-1 TaxID=2065820 RepID=UPI001303FC6C|nr:hypothetical protein [Hydrogenovibrio sp. SC-1]